jgi:zinc transport system ATP-binding protein
MTILLISHELEIVRKYTTTVLCLNKEQVCYGPPSLVLNEKTIDKLFGEEMHYYHHKHKN